MRPKVVRDDPYIANVAYVADGGRVMGRLLDIARTAPTSDPETSTAHVVTPQQGRELQRLIDLILVKDSEADRAEALAVARADPHAALISFRALIAEMGGVR